MSRRYFSADWHLDHGNIIKYCNRPFKNPEHMNRRIIGGANERAKPNDRLVLVGDSKCYGNEKGVAGLRNSWHSLSSQILADLTVLEGNHDKQNGVKSVGQHLFGTMGQHTFFATHYPTDSLTHADSLLDYVDTCCDFVLCGHVHDAWKTKMCDGMLNINVGVDVWNYRPVSDDEILSLYQKERR